MKCGAYGIHFHRKESQKNKTAKQQNQQPNSNECVVHCLHTVHIHLLASLYLNCELAAIFIANSFACFLALSSGVFFIYVCVCLLPVSLAGTCSGINAPLFLFVSLLLLVFRHTFVLSFCVRVNNHKVSCRTVDYFCCRF